MLPIQNGAAFVLGGTGGLGRAICTAFAEAGVPVAFTFRSREEEALALCAELGRIGSGAKAWQLDGVDRRQVERVLAEAEAALGPISSVIYAGGPPFKPEFFSRISEGVWQDWLQGDVLAAVNLAQSALPYLRRTKGAMVMISSYQGNMIEVRGGVSAISKAAIDRMVAVIAKEEGRYGVRANALRCGWIESPTNDRLLEQMPELADSKCRSIPLGRLGLPREIADAVVFLASPAAGFITGNTITADGGESL